MYRGVIRPCMTLRRQRMKLSREVVHKLKDVSRVYAINGWEYAGGIEYRNFEFSTPTRIT